MSDTGFPRFTSILRSTGAEKLSPLPEGRAHILSLPEGVRAEVITLRESLHLQGEITQENRDHSVRVRTERGDIDIQVQNQRGALKRGARVEIEIPPSRITGRDTPDVALVTVREAAPRHRSDHTPIEIEVRGRPSEAEKNVRPSLATHVQRPSHPHSQAQHTPPVQTLPPEGSVVRLKPLALLDAPLPAAADVLNHAVSPAPDNVVLTQGQAAAGHFLVQSQLPIVSGEALSGLGHDGSLQQPSGQASAILNIPLPSSAVVQGIVPSSFGEGVLSGGAAALSSVSARASDLDVRIDRILLPEISLLPSSPSSQAPESLIAQNQSATGLVGVVTGVTDGQLPSIRISFSQSGQSALFSLQSPVDYAIVGTRIEVTPQNMALHGQTHSTSGMEALAALPLSAQIAPQPWVLMEDIHTHLSQAVPQAAQVMSNIMPSPSNPVQFGPAALFFISALRGGDLSQWLGGKALEALSKEGGKSLLNRLTQEGASLSRIATESPSQDWRIAHLPLAWDGQIQKIALYYRHEQSESDDGLSGPQGTRFVFDLALDRMGKIQIDGLFRPMSGQGKRLDLLVRAEEAFGQAAQAEMRKLYTAALRHSDVGGELSFQHALQSSQWAGVELKEEQEFATSV